MDPLSLLGLLLGLAALVGGNYLEGGHLGALVNGPAAIIVVGGTVGAALIQTSLPSFKRALVLLRWVVFPPRIQIEDGIAKVILWSQTARKEGLLGLEPVAELEPDSFCRKGLELLVDGCEPEQIRNVLELELYAIESRDLYAAKVYEGMGGYAPTIGIIGAVLGLIHVMGNLADPSRLGAGIATAFVATVYGVGFANLLLLPVSNKLKAIVRQGSQYREMLIEGLLSIADGENPKAIELKLKGFVS